MKKASDFPKILLFRGATDMRKQSHGLSELVQDSLKEDPFSDCLFLFANRRRNIIKALYFDRAGFCLWTKSLDRNTFPWLRDGEVLSHEMTSKDLDLLFEGVDVFRRHKKLEFDSVS